MFQASILTTIKDCSKCVTMAHQHQILYEIVYRESKPTIVSFRGSKTYQDWMYNFQCYSHSENTKIHSGLYKRYKELSEDLFDSLKNDNRAVIFTGYSCGGVMACLAAFDYHNTHSCITFATPSFANHEWTEEFMKKVPETYRVIYNDDPISNLPISFENVGHVIHLHENESKKITFYPYTSKSTNKNKSIRFNVKDHNIKLYEKYFDS